GPSTTTDLSDVQVTRVSWASDRPGRSCAVRRCVSAFERLRARDLNGDVRAAGCGVARLLTDRLAVDHGAERRGGREDVEVGRVGHLAGAEQEGHLVPTDECRHDHARLDLAV